MPVASASSHLHGRMGVFCGGEWVPWDEAPEKWNCDIEDPPSYCCAKSKLGEGEYDVAVIGAGCVGAAIARELAKYHVKVVVLEAADDVTQGATKGNSGIVHAGYDDTPGTNRSKFCPVGNQMFPDLDRELHFGYELTGSLVLATNEEEVKELHKLLEKGKTNG